jgi:hypothetical protein
MSYHVGDLVRCAGAFTNAGGTAVDPTAVFAQYSNPAGSVTSLTYGTDAALVKASTGNYYVDINANAAGYWRYRFYSTGTGQAASEAESFQVYASSLT